MGSTSKIDEVNHHFQRLSFSVLFAIGFVLAIGPLDFFPGGHLAIVSLFLLSRSLMGSGILSVLAWSAITIINLQIAGLYWMIAGFINIGHLDYYQAFLLFVFSGFVIHLKIPAFLVISRFLTSVLKLSIFPVMLFCIMLTDMGLNYIIPWRWGNLIAGNPWMRQFSALFGIAGLGFGLLLESYLVYEMLQIIKFSVANKKRKPKNRKNNPVFHSRPGIAFSIIVLVLIYSWSIFKYYSKESHFGNIQASIIQTNIRPGLNEFRDDNAYAGNALNTMVNYSLKSVFQAKGQSDLLILPESVVPFYSTDKTNLFSNKQSRIYSPTFHNSIRWLSAYAGVDIIYNELIEASEMEYYNAISVFSFYQKKKEGSYYKQRLLPFGEYLPFKKTFPWLQYVFSETSSYARGNSRQYIQISKYEKKRARIYPRQPAESLSMIKEPSRLMKEWPNTSQIYLNGISILPLVCYESLFPDITMRMIENNKKLPDLIVNLSNDAWFDSSLEIYQHAMLARMRAVETGRYMIRSNLNGYSAIYDSRGNLYSGPLAINKPGIITASIPILNSNPNLYQLWGDWPIGLFYLAFMVLLIRSISKKHKKTGP